MSARDLPPDIQRQVWLHQAAALRRSIRRSVAKGLEALQTPPPLTLDEWAEQHFYLSAESSQGEKRWQSYPFQRGMLGAMGDDDIEEVDIRKSARVGYALALDTPVPTLNGWTTMGDIREGETVFDENGKPCRVTYTSPIYTDHDCYRITFSDGTQVVADAGHRWMVESILGFEYLLGERGAGRIGRPQADQVTTKRGVVDTAQLAKMVRSPRGRTALAVVNTLALELPDAELPMPPYTLGLWLGDGHMVSPRITQHRADVETARYIEAEGIRVSIQYLDTRYQDNATYFLDCQGGRKDPSPWASVMRRMGVLSNKHIPPVYLRASRAQRLQLLRGLMDSDGNATGKTGAFSEFVNTNKNLADGVYELVVSLGFKATVRPRRPRNPKHLLQYRICFRATPESNPFNLSRKAASVVTLEKPSITLRRRIVAVDAVEAVPVRCISVDSPSSLFLCSRAMIPTHNTKMLLASIGYDAQHKRRNQALWQPTDGDSDEFCKAELEPMLRDVRIMQTVFPRFMAKSKANTLNMKKFLGSILYLKGGTSAGNFRRMTLQSAKLDEFDAFDQRIEKSADPFTLAHKRLEGATYPKIICGTTPRIKGLSHIEKREAAAEARLRYHITCPHCQVEHPLSWGGPDKAHGFKWDAHDPEGTVRHVCPHCHGHIRQADYLRLWHEGVWVSECGNYRLHGRPYRWTDGRGTPLTRPPRHVAFHVWTAYSPQTTWAAIVRQFLQCIAAKLAGDKAPLEGFINETLGETWEEEVEKAEAHELQKRAEDYPLRRVPVGGLQLVAGVDVQERRWEVTVWAIGRGEEMWAVDYQVIDGDPAQDRDWEERLHPYLQAPLTHWHGAPMQIAAASIDTGGHFTHQTYSFCRRHQGKRYFAIKGDSQDSKPIKGRASLQDVNERGRIVKNGVKLWLVGTDTAKDTIFQRLNVKQPGPGYVHFSKQLPLEWFKGFTAEVRRTVRTSTGEKYRWVKTAQRNEPLDCFDAETEVLTHRGWIRFADASMADRFATVNLATDHIEYQAPTHLIERHFEGELLCVEGTRLNFAVTPNHRMVTYRKVFDRASRKWNFDVPPEITLAKDLTIHHTIKINARWEPFAPVTAIHIPASLSGQSGKEIQPAVRVSAADMASFLGWFVAEGHLSKTQQGASVRRRVCISQVKPECRALIEQALTKLPWKWHYDGKAYVITSKQLFDYVQSVCPGDQFARRVPEWVRWSSPEVIEAFVSAAVSGDGWVQGSARSYATISKLLADDMAELFFKLGGSPSVTPRTPKESRIRGRVVSAGRTQFWVRENPGIKSRALDGAGRKFMVTPRPYSGNVYCATVPNGTLVVRRQGKMMVAGNCTVYALHSSAMLDHYKLSEAQWSRLANDLLPDLFDAPTPTEALSQALYAPPLAGSPPEPLPALTLPPLPPLSPGQLEIRDAAATAAPATNAAATTTPATPADLAAILAQQPPPLRRRKPTTPPPAAPAAPFVSPFAKPEWSSRL